MYPKWEREADYRQTGFCMAFSHGLAFEHLVRLKVPRPSVRELVETGTPPWIEARLVGTKPWNKSGYIHLSHHDGV